MKFSFARQLRSRELHFKGAESHKPGANPGALPLPPLVTLERWQGRMAAA